MFNAPEHEIFHEIFPESGHDSTKHTCQGPLDVQVFFG